MNKEQTIDDIISKLDDFAERGGGHMNISVEENGSIKTQEFEAKDIEIANSLDCAKGNLACNVPTLHKGIDDLLDD